MKLKQHHRVLLSTLGSIFLAAALAVVFMTLVIYAMEQTS